VRRKSGKHCGFTLVEILVVILIISILAGMLILVAIPTTDMAMATKIVNNFKVIQKASIVCHSEDENSEWWPGGTNNEAKKVSDLAEKYTDSPNINDGGAYRIWGGSGTSTYGIWLILDLTKIGNTDNLKSIFKAKANGGLGVQLYKIKYNTKDMKNPNKLKTLYDGGDEVFFCISESYY